MSPIIPASLLPAFQASLGEEKSYEEITEIVTTMIEESMKRFGNARADLWKMRMKRFKPNPEFEETSFHLNGEEISDHRIYFHLLLRLAHQDGYFDFVNEYIEYLEPIFMKFGLRSLNVIEGLEVELISKGRKIGMYVVADQAHLADPVFGGAWRLELRQAYNFVTGRPS